MNKKQKPEALRLAEMLTADEWPGSVTLVSYARECVAELLRQHAENETVRAGYAAARLEIESLKAQGAAYAALPDEREMLKHALWLASSFTVHRYLMSNAEGRWSGAEKAACHDELCCLYVAVFRGVEVDQVRVDLEADWMAVHDATQELTDHMDVVIGFPLKGVPDYEALAPKFFDHFHRLATHALRASHGQAPAEPEGISREDWIEQAVRVYLIAGDTDEQAQECAAYLWGELDMDDLADPYDAAMSDIEGRNMPRKETQ